MTEQEAFFAFIIAAVIAAQIVKRRVVKDEEGRIKDQSVTRELVLKHLRDFSPKREDRLKNGYTEKSIEKQLDVFLKRLFVSVKAQYTIGGIRGTSIDFSIGSQAVGVELKLLRKLFKSSEFHRLQGQLGDYQAAFPDDSLIVFAVGESSDLDDRPHIAEITEMVSSKNAELLIAQITA